MRNYWVAGTIAAVIVAVGVWYFLIREDVKVETAEEALRAFKGADVSTIQVESNPIQKVPDVNPVDRTNPFKYVNPLAP